MDCMLELAEVLLVRDDGEATFGQRTRIDSRRAVASYCRPAAGLSKLHAEYRQRRRLSGVASKLGPGRC